MPIAYSEMEGRVVIDFDINGFFAPWRTIAIMCWPDVADRRSRLATMGINFLGEAETVFDKFLKRAAQAAAEGIPARGSLDKLISECSGDSKHRRLIRKFAEDIGRAAASPGLQGIDPEKLFWVYLSYRPAREAFPYILISSVKSGLIDPCGGFTAVGREASLDTIAADFAKSLVGSPMLAGMVFVVLASLRAQWPELASKNVACELIEGGTKVEGGMEIESGMKIDSVKRGKDSTTRAWRRWSVVGPLWAGMLSEAGCVDGTWQYLGTQLEATILQVIATDERRGRAFGFAKWYRDEIALRGSARRPEPLLTAGTVIGLPDSIAAIEPTFEPIPKNLVLDASGRLK
jgi:hypothetical protein